ncbi:transposase [Rhizobium sp. RAF56]|uniref:transposase n=1 Tax=Rhizobium sp. RAF56 TaxID=3233062 RepID=UPI003F95AC4C
MTITGFPHSTSVDVPVQRFELFAGAGRCRDWRDEEKDQIIAESYSGEMSVSAVARRHGVVAGAIVHLAAAGAKAGGASVAADTCAGSDQARQSGVRSRESR